MKRILTLTALAAALALPATALAGHVDIGINLGAPVYAPPPVVVAPAPVYAPPPVYYAPPPAVVYPAPAYGPPGYFWYGGRRCWWRHGYRMCR
jgi:hypothetical protein